MRRRLRVPEWVDGERVTADYADGVLTVAACPPPARLVEDACLLQ